MEPPPLSNRFSLYKWTISALRRHGIRPRKRYSQNFVVEPSLILDFINNIDPNKSVLELGAGIGTLSYYVSRRTRRYSVHIELDEKLAWIAEKLVSPLGTIICGDALGLDWFFEQVISNIPYHITSDILVKTVRSNSVTRAVYVMQKDVAERLSAEPGTRDYGRLTVLIQLAFMVEKKNTYPPIFFYPRPKVYSQMILLRRIRPYDRVLEKVEEITRILFNRRRKLAYRILAEEVGLDENEIQSLGIDKKTRVYEISPEVFMKLATIILEKK